MGACSSVDVGKADAGQHIIPLPDGSLEAAKQQQTSSSLDAASNTALPQSHSPSIAATSISASASASDPQLCSSPPSDTRSDMRAALAILTSPPSSSRSNRQSTFAALDSPQTTVRLTSLKLETEGADESGLFSPHSAAGAVSSRRATGGEGTIIQVRTSAAADLTASADNEAAAAPQHRSLSPKAFALNSRRQEQIAAEEEQSRAQQTRTEQQQAAAQDSSSPQPVVAAESEASVKHAAFFKPRRRSLSKRQQRRGSDRQQQTEEKRLTLDAPLHSVLQEVAAVETAAPNVAAAAPLSAAAAGSSEGKRLSMSSLFPFNLKKSASVDLLSLPTAPTASARVSSETAILDVIRSIGQQHTVSVNTLSQYTRCMPPTLAGPAPRSPRVSFSSSTPTSGPLPCCAKLHCPSCGMDVMMLDHHRWVDGVKRETFAACYPDVNKLRSSLQPSVGSRAYCCACSWCDVKTLRLIGSQTSADKKISWICAGHQ